MRTNLIWSLLAIMMAAVVSIGTASCSDDDDDGGGDSRLVGKWYEVHSDHTAAWKFNSNGTCQYSEWGRYDSEYFSRDREDIARWKVKGKKLNVHWSYDDGDYDDYTFEYSISTDGKTLTLTGGDGGKAGTYVKQ